ncbi:MAG: hypothetical protein ABSG43_25970 [Solirubrobacteraceae bacterium]|jgi:acyl-CoA synthetase (AMP-forming)/AMP-acid ligase II
MIVSGGTSFFPKDAEHVLVSHEAVAEATVAAVSEQRFSDKACARS